MDLLGTEDARFGLAAAEGPWMGVSGTKIAEKGLGEAVRGQLLAEFCQRKFGNSKNV